MEKKLLPKSLQEEISFDETQKTDKTVSTNQKIFWFGDISREKEESMIVTDRSRTDDSHQQEERRIDEDKKFKKNSNH